MFDAIEIGYAMQRNMLMLFVSLSILGCDVFEPISRPSASSKDVVGKGEGIGDAERSATGPTPSKGVSGGPGMYERREQSVRFLRVPKLSAIDFPTFAGRGSIDSSLGTDSQGRIYFGVSGSGLARDPGARVIRFDSNSGGFEDLGVLRNRLLENANRSVRDFGVDPPILKLVDRWVMEPGGKLYFLGTESGSSGIFTFDPKSELFDCVWKTATQLSGMSISGDSIFAEGYSGGSLFRLDTKTGEVHATSDQGHEGVKGSRGFGDGNGRFFSLRTRPAEDDELNGIKVVEGQRTRIELVEFDETLRKVFSWPFGSDAVKAPQFEAIAGSCQAAENRMLFVTRSGGVWELSPQRQESSLRQLGWMDPKGVSRCVGFFPFWSGRYLGGIVQSEAEQPSWVIFDTELQRSVKLPIGAKNLEVMSKANSQILGVGGGLGGPVYFVGYTKQSNSEYPYAIELVWE